MVVFCVGCVLDQIVVGIAITLLARGRDERRSRVPSSPRVLPAPAGGVDGRDPGPRPSIPIVGQGSTEPLQPAARGLPRLRASSRSWPGCSAARTTGLNLRAAGEKPQALDAAGVSVVATRSLGRALDRRARGPRRRATSSIAGAGDLRALHDAGPGLHRDRDRDARPRPPALGPDRGVHVRDVAVARRRRCRSRDHRHLDGRHQHDPVRRHHARPHPVRARRLPAARARAAVRQRGAR